MMTDEELADYCNAVAAASYKKRNLVISTSHESTFVEAVKLRNRVRPRIPKKGDKK